MSVRRLILLYFAELTIVTVFIFIQINNKIEKLKILKLNLKNKIGASRKISNRI